MLHDHAVSRLYELIAQTPKGRRALTQMSYWTAQYLDGLPNHMELGDRYLLSIVRQDLLEMIATQLGIEF